MFGKQQFVGKVDGSVSDKYELVKVLIKSFLNFVFYFGNYIISNRIYKKEIN